MISSMFTVGVAVLCSRNKIVWYFSVVLVTLVSCSHFKLSLGTYCNGLEYSSCLNVMLTYLASSICLLCLLAGAKKSHDWSLSLLIIMTYMFSIGCINSHSIFWLYILLEIAIIPMLLIILQGGSQPERLSAVSYMIAYTMMGSLPMLLFLWWFFGETGSWSLPGMLILGFECSAALFMVSIFAFLVKAPSFGLHMWLTKAHVEAPAVGSMFLAGVLLKLGGYGLMMMSQMLSVKSTVPILLLVVAHLWGSLQASLGAVAQSDMKGLVAYSSVVVMGFVVVAIIWGSPVAYYASAVLMFAHGISSSSLFFITSTASYMIGSRSSLLLGSMRVTHPVLALFLLISCFLNLGCPPFMNFFGEILILMSLINKSYMLSVVMLLVIMISTVYNMVLYLSISSPLKSSNMIQKSEAGTPALLVMVAHWLPSGIFLMLSFF